MLRLLSFGLLTSLLITTSATAHFVFLLPNGTDKAKAVFSDALKPDNQGVPVEKISKTKLMIRDGGKNSEAKWIHDKTANCYTFDVPGSGSRIAFGVTDYGVFQRGESKPMWLKYYPKTILGEIATPELSTVGDSVAIELIPIVENGKLRFKALNAGKPIAKGTVTVMIPGEPKAIPFTTDNDGLTETFEKKGLYGAYSNVTETKSGEQDGKKYEEIRNYATLVVNFDK